LSNYIKNKGDFALRPYLNIVRQYKKPYKYILFGKEIIIFPKVMSPKYEWSSKLHIKVIKERDFVNKRVLDLGSGTGVLGVFSYLNGAKDVVGVDINHDATQNTYKNYEKYIDKINYRVIRSDLFNNLDAGEKFDIIICNSPYHSFEADLTSDYLELGVSDYQYNTLKKFFREVSEYMVDNGEIHFGFSDTGDLNLLYEEINKNNFFIEDVRDKFYNGYNVKVLILRKKSGLEFLDNFYEENLEKIDLSKILLITCHHILESHHQLLVKLLSLGLKPSNIYAIGKPYSTSNETMSKYKALGVYVDNSSNFFDSFYSFSSQFKNNVKNFAEYVLKYNDLNKYDRVIVWDDGGELISILNKIAGVKYKKKIFCIEQTSSGTNYLNKLDKKKKLFFPVINVARAKSKLLIESRFIAEDAVEKISYLLGETKYIKSVLILGGGSIGYNMKKALLKKYNKVDIYDLKSELSDISYKEFIENFNNYELIVGASGTNSVSVDMIKLSKGLKILVSVSSSDFEFPAKYLRGYNVYERYKIHRYIVHKTVTSDNVMLLNNGFPINFDGKPINVKLEKIQITDTLILVAIYQILKMKFGDFSLFYKPKIIPLNKRIDELIFDKLLQELMCQ
jgi:release factor glutamine methyltransferase